MVSTLMLKDTSDRTAFKVFEPGGTADLPGFGQANNLLLLPDPASFKQLPWAQGTGWLRASPGSRTARRCRWTRAACCNWRWAAGMPQALACVCGLEVEFHIYRIDDDKRPAAGPGAGRLARPAARRVA
jgi:glutamine synthetase